MMKSKSVFVIGAFGYRNDILGGQTVKTRNIYAVLKTEFNVKYFDTEDLKGSPFLVFSLLFYSLVYKNIYYVGGKSNLKCFFPILMFLSLIRRSSIVYVTVGGWLYEFLQTNHKLYFFLVKRCKAILVQTEGLKKQLEDIGLGGVSVIPNFRMVLKTPIADDRKDKIFKLVFMSRIVEEKGIFLIFDLIKRLKNELDFSITFFGPIDNKNKLTFEEKIKLNASHAEYGGVLKPDEIYEHLVNYDVLLLPTFHPGEGFPGTILDSYISSLPVIATRWKQIPEFIDEGKTGFLVDYDVEQFFEKIMFLASDVDLLLSMKKNAKEKSSEYSADRGLAVLKETMFQNS